MRQLIRDEAALPILIKLAQSLEAPVEDVCDALVAELATSCCGVDGVGNGKFASCLRYAKMAVPRLVALIRELDTSTVPGLPAYLTQHVLLPALQTLHTLPTDATTASYRALAAALLLHAFVVERELPAEKLLPAARAMVNAANTAFKRGEHDLAGRLILVRTARPARMHITFWDRHSLTVGISCCSCARRLSLSLSRSWTRHIPSLKPRRLSSTASRSFRRCASESSI